MAKRSHPWFRKHKNAWYVWVGTKQMALGVKGEENEAAAIKAWHKLMAELPEPTPKPKPEDISVKDVLTAYWTDCEGRIKPKTLHDYKVFLNDFVVKHGKVKVSNLTAAMAEKYARKPTWSASTQHDFLGILASAFAWAERMRLIDRTPLVGIVLSVISL